MSVIPLNHNFPFDLNIRPSTSSATRSEDTRFGEIAQASAISKFGIAGRVWEASYILLSYLDCSNRDAPDQLEFDPPPFTRMACADPLTIIELGSGTGLIASRIAEHLRVDRDLLLATDLPDVCGLLEGNLQACPAIRVQPLTWGSTEAAVALAIFLGLTTPGANEAHSPRHPTHIICSDLVYFPALLAPLLRTLLHVTSPPFRSPAGESAVIVISYKIRSLPKETPFWSAFGLWFEYAPVLALRVGLEAGAWCRFPITLDGEDESYVFVARRRSESRTWTIPENDRDLLAGVGAWGTSEGKVDDSFETMLLMSLNPVHD